MSSGVRTVESGDESALNSFKLKVQERARRGEFSSHAMARLYNS